MRAIIGKKIGMTQVNDSAGNQVAATLVQAGPCVVLQRKTMQIDGYEAAQLGFIEQAGHRITRAQSGHFKKAGVTAFRHIREVRLVSDEEASVGQTITVDIFQGVSHVDVSGTTKGQGFQGVVKRHKMGGGPASHGHMSHRRIGAIGQRTWPARILKLKRMPGHMGNRNITVQNLRVVQLRSDENVLVLEGSIPGAVGQEVYIRKAIKKS